MDRNSFVERLFEVIEANIGNSEFRSKDLAREMGMSQNNLLSKVRSLTGKNINQLIREIRLKKAFELLGQGEVNINDVAYRVGYNTPSYFIYCFRKEFGYSPGEVRKMDPEIAAGRKEPGETDLRKSRIIRRVRAIRGIKPIVMICLAFLIVLAGFVILSGPDGKFRKVQSIAILPSENISHDSLGAFFSEKFWEQMMQSLARVKSFDVKPASTMELYRNSDKLITEIRRELNVDYVIESSVNLNGDRVKIIIQLIDARTDFHHGTEEYDINLGETFSQLGEIADHLAGQMTVRLKPEDKSYIKHRGTKSSGAWQCWLQGNYWMSKGDVYSNILLADSFYRRAIELDPEWADPYLSRSYVLKSLFKVHRREEYKRERLEMIGKANDLRPAPDTYLALANYYVGDYNIRKAAEYQRKAWKEASGMPEINYFCGVIAPNLGRWKQAEKRLLKALEEAPDVPQRYHALGMLYNFMRNFPLAVKYLEESLTFMDIPWSVLCLSDIALKNEGDTGKAREILANRLEFSSWDSVQSTSACYQLAMIDMYEGKYREALDELARWREEEPSYSFPSRYRPKYLLNALNYGYLGQTDLEHANYDSTRLFIESQLQLSPDFLKDPEITSCLGVAWAGLGEYGKADELAGITKQLLADNPDAISSPKAMEDVAWIYTMTGNGREALNILKKVLQKPGPLTFRIVEMDPKWAPLRHLPGYSRLAKKYSSR